jgi:hypothetical protein
VWQCDTVVSLVVVIVSGGRSSVFQVRVWVSTGLNLDLDLNIYTYGCKTGSIYALIGRVRMDTRIILFLRKKEYVNKASALVGQ